MVHLIITVTLRPDSVDDYVAAFAAIAAAVRLESGCIEYDVYRDSTDTRFDNEKRPDTVVICEKWESIEALQAHTRHSSVLNQFRRVVKDIKIESRYRLLVPAAAASRPLT
jgi:quinol monooxygenase YgiN